MTLEQKIGQFFLPAVFNDSEENIQAMERLIKEYNIGGLTFHSRPVAATNYETNKKNCIQCVPPIIINEY
jgi:hypothetical protein